MNRTVVRARFALETEHFWKMRSAKYAPDCGESSISHKDRKKACSKQRRICVVDFPLSALRKR